MKILEKSKYVIIGVIFGLGFVGLTTYAAVTGSGKLGSLFEKVGLNYMLVGSNIKDSTISQNKLKTTLSDKIDKISTNTSAISTNKSDISTNKSAISTNKSAISTNKSAISTNTSDISTNTSDISTNTSDISTNTSDIASIPVPNLEDVLTEGNTTTEDLKIGTSKISYNDLYIADKIYDWDNTSYYLDPSGYSILNYLIVGGKGVNPGQAGVTGCYSSTVGKYSMKADGTLRKCVKTPGDTKTLDSGYLRGTHYYNSAQYSCANYSLFGLSCPSGYYNTGGRCWYKWRYSSGGKKRDGRVEMYCKRNAYYNFQIQ